VGTCPRPHNLTVQPCQSVHIISLPMRCPALVVVVVHLVGDPRMLGGHGVEPGAPLVERVVPLSTGCPC
jgi:hypothetical protein